MKNIPEIRFAGFSGEWERRKFGEVFIEYSEKNHDELPPLTIIQGKGTILREESDRNLIYDKSGLKNYKLVNKDDFILHLRSFEGGLEKANSRGIVSPAYHIFNGEKTDTRFYYPFFRSKYFISVLLKPHVYGIRDGKSIDIEGMKSIKIPYPTIEEQQAIGEYFQNIDRLITLHKSKCEKLKLLKAAMLEKMFPKNGSSVPEIRLAGFADPWERRKLGDIANRITRKNQNLEATRPLTISAQYGLINQNEFFDKRIASKDVSGYYLLKKGEFAYNKSYSGDAPWGAVKRLDRYENGVLSTLYIVFELNENANIDSDFVVTYYATDRWYKEVQAIAAEGARNHGLLNISPNDFFETVLTIPKSVEEQKQIGSYFANLDRLIALQQRKYEKLKLFKTAMLEKMFPKGD